MGTAAEKRKQKIENHSRQKRMKQVNADEKDSDHIWEQYVENEYESEYQKMVRVQKSEAGRKKFNEQQAEAQKQAI
jgi:hypothetical protein